MPLPPMTQRGELPEGIHKATLTEVFQRFGDGSFQRQIVTKRLLRIYDLAQSTGFVDEFLIFGSYITDEEGPNDVDIVLIMNDNFDVSQCEEPAATLFNHLETEVRLGQVSFGYDLD